MNDFSYTVAVPGRLRGRRDAERRLGLAGHPLGRRRRAVLGRPHARRAQHRRAQPTPSSTARRTRPSSARSSGQQAVVELLGRAEDRRHVGARARRPDTYSVPVTAANAVPSLLAEALLQQIEQLLSRALRHLADGRPARRRRAAAEAASTAARFTVGFEIAPAAGGAAVRERRRRRQRHAAARPARWSATPSAASTGRSPPTGSPLPARPGSTWSLSYDGGATWKTETSDGSVADLTTALAADIASDYKPLVSGSQVTFTTGWNVDAGGTPLVPSAGDAYYVSPLNLNTRVDESTRSTRSTSTTSTDPSSVNGTLTESSITGLGMGGDTVDRRRDHPGRHHATPSSSRSTSTSARATTRLRSRARAPRRTRSSRAPAATTSTSRRSPATPPSTPAPAHDVVNVSNNGEVVAHRRPAHGRHGRRHGRHPGRRQLSRREQFDRHAHRLDADRSRHADRRRGADAHRRGRLAARTSCARPATARSRSPTQARPTRPRRRSRPRSTGSST